MIPRDFDGVVGYNSWQWFEADPENVYKIPQFNKMLCKVCGCIVVMNYQQAHAKLHFARKEGPPGMVF